MALDLTMFYKNNNFKHDGKFHYGIYRERLISIILSGGYVKITLTFNRPLTREVGSLLSSKITKLKNENRVVQTGLTTNVSLELVLYQSGDINEEFYRILDIAIDLVNEFQQVGCETCPICGQVMSPSDPFIRVRDSAVQGHERCVSQVIGSVENLNNQSKTKKKYLMYVFCFLSLLTIVGLTILFGYLNAMNYFIVLTGWGSMFINKLMLKKCKIMFGKKELIVTSIFASLTVLLSFTCGVFATIMSSLGMSINEVISNMGAIYAENIDVFKWFLFDLLFTILLLCSSILFSVKQIKYTMPNIYRL